MMQYAGWLMFFKHQTKALNVYATLANATDRFSPYQRAGARFAMANLYASRNESADAIAIFDDLTKDFPQVHEYAYNLAFMQEASDLDVAAEENFKRVIALSPKHDRAWYGLGLVHAKHHRYAQAIAAFTENTRIQAMSPYGWYQLAMTQQKAGNAAEAQRIQKHLLSFDPKYARGLQEMLDKANIELSTQNS